jgi:hypothetical protein
MQKPVEDKTSSVYIFDINLGLFMLNACGVVMVRPSPLRATLYLYLCLLMILPFSTFYYSEFLNLALMIILLLTLCVLTLYHHATFQILDLPYQINLEFPSFTLFGINAVYPYVSIRT